MKRQEIKVITINKKLHHDFNIIEEIESGISLKGWEVKSIRNHEINIKGGWVRFNKEEAFLEGIHIAQYPQSREKMDPVRVRKLLLKKQEILTYQQKIKEQGLTLLPYRVYFNNKGRVKVLLALCKPKKIYDKREAIKKKEYLRKIEKLHKKKYNK